MKKLLGIAAFILALTPLAQAQNGAGLSGHPDARNDRPAEPQTQGRKGMDKHHVGGKHMHHAKHHAKHHHQAHHPK